MNFGPVEGAPNHPPDPGRSGSRKRMLLVVNPHATTVSTGLQTLVRRALESRYAVEPVETRGPGHATELARRAVRERCDIVVAFGGDGTVNETANGLAGSDVPMTCLPGGATNVFGRILGIPSDVTEATERLLHLADGFTPRRIDTGVVNGRHFVFSSGVGLDARVVRHVDRRPQRKAGGRHWYFAATALSRFLRVYLADPPRFRIEAEGRGFEAIALIVQNADPFSFFGRRPVRVARGGVLDSGSLAMAVMTRAGPLDALTLGARLLSGRPGAVLGHAGLESLSAVTDAQLTALGGSLLPVQVDGDYLGEFERVRYQVRPGSLAVVG